MNRTLKVEETAGTISSYECSDERTAQLYPNSFWKKTLTDRLYQTVNEFDKIIQASQDSIAVSVLCALPALCNGATVSQSKDVQGRPIILFWAYFAKSGMGKSVLANTVRKYLLFWLDNQFLAEEKNSKDEDLVLPDIFLDAASAEGLEQSIAAKSAPHFFLDEYGKFYRASKSDNVKGSLLRSLMQIFDSGVLITRKLKDSKRSKHLMVQGMGLYAASTIGPTNLTPSDMRNMISDGMLNRFLVIFGELKDIPLQQELNKEATAAIESFARKFREYAAGKAYYLSVDAYEAYKQFHKDINGRYRHKYFANDDTAGFEIRLLTIVQRIAMLLQVAINVENESPDITDIGVDAMDRAVGILDYLYERHFQNVLAYANEKQTKLTLEEKIIKQLNKGTTLTLRNIVRNVSPASTSDVQAILEELILKKWVTSEGNNIYTRAQTDTDKTA